ncbi:hypothetical protein HDU83_002964 [Entophlyctis luteolus]|nr:hypothetical protein HDU83_002964 [Entophlyctis luteolus]
MNSSARSNVHSRKRKRGAFDWAPSSPSQSTNLHYSGFSIGSEPEADRLSLHPAEKIRRLEIRTAAMPCSGLVSPASLAPSAFVPSLQSHSLALLPSPSPIIETAGFSLAKTCHGSINGTSGGDIGIASSIMSLGSEFGLEDPTSDNMGGVECGLASPSPNHKPSAGFFFASLTDSDAVSPPPPPPSTVFASLMDDDAHYNFAGTVGGWSHGLERRRSLDCLLRGIGSGIPIGVGVGGDIFNIGGSPSAAGLSAMGSPSASGVCIGGRRRSLDVSLLDGFRRTLPLTSIPPAGSWMMGGN